MHQLAQRGLLALAFYVLVSIGIPVNAHDGEKHDEASQPPLILGVLDFPNSGSAAAQDAFARGVMLLHSFEFDDARSAFLEAQAIDPGFAMAYWGEAMTLNHPLWASQDRNGALEALSKLPANSPVTVREQDYINAVRVLYGNGSKPERDQAYMQAMARLYNRYPQDLEAASFYALSILGSVYQRDVRTYMKAAAILEEVFALQPLHPGAAHYLIHSYDDQVHAPLGLRAARVYNQIAPSASHAQHMVSHIYTSLGMWDEVVQANTNAVRVSEESLKRAGKSVTLRSKHALHWLEYALLQQGQFEAARNTLATMKDDLAQSPVGHNKVHSIMFRGSWIVEQPLADPILEPLDTSGFSLYFAAVQSFASAFRLISLDELESAKQELAALQERIDHATVLTVAEGLHETEGASSADDYQIASIIAGQLQALLMFREGKTNQALELLARVESDENSRPMIYGPPDIPKPSSELMGEMLLSLDRGQDAIGYFRKSLDRNTGRTLSLLGLARAQDAVGDSAASVSWQQAKTNWRSDPAALLSTRYVWLQP